MTTLKVLVVHNFYQKPGGEDGVFDDETRLLRMRGHAVIHYTAHNDSIRNMMALEVALRTMWSNRTFQELRELLRRERPDVAHVHNTLPLISPAVYFAASVTGVPVVQTLHNYRIACPNGLCFRDNRCCTDCVGRPVPWPGVLHACYRDSRSATAVITAMLSTHRMLGTWRNRVNVYIAPTEFSRSLLVNAGLPPNKVVVKPHFVDPDPGIGAQRRGYALFVGRLSSEKGITTLLQAWQQIGGDVPLRIVGDGPLGPAVAAAVASTSGVSWLGMKTPPEVVGLMREADFLVFPSEWYETFGRVIIEAFATATPVIAAGHGAAAELVHDGTTGLHFRPGDSVHLAAKVKWLSSNPDVALRMRSAARAEFEARYTADANYHSLMSIYQDVRRRS
jgi:glycosyltransferase involved in cell wall biosynthesis